MSPSKVSESAKSARAVRNEQADKLFIAELQFRLASAVRVATTFKNQPLDLPTRWSHGRHSVSHGEIALRPDQADVAARFLHRSATYLLAVAIKDALKLVFIDPKNSSDANIQSAYQIARLIRNAFTHSPFAPVWSIDPDCRDKVFSIPDVVSLDASALHGKKFDWRHYGGPLALLKLCRFVRGDLLGVDLTRTKKVPPPKTDIIQMGDMILKRIARIPKNAKRVKVKRDKAGRIDLGGGYSIG